MSILIKGAKMPKECEYCMFAGFGGAENEYYVCMFNGKSKDRDNHGRMESCPLVEIPPHGRLIDADETKRVFGDYFEKIKVARRYAESLVDNAIPTVIESEEE